MTGLAGQFCQMESALRFTRTEDKTNRTMFSLVLATVTNDDRYDARPFRSKGFDYVITRLYFYGM